VEFIMRWDWTPSIVPDSGDQNAYLEMDDLGRLGRIWPEAHAEATDLETVITNLLIAALFANAHDAPAAQRLAAYYHRKLIRSAKLGFMAEAPIPPSWLRMPSHRLVRRE
jgi:hypothetical protein